MPSSGYTSITFVADELLTSTKMNLMGANDAAFNNGNGINDAAIIARHIKPGDATGLKNIQIFTSSGTYTKPAGMTGSAFVIVEAVGGGGGGGGTSPTNASQHSVGGGGGGGGYCKKKIDAGSLGATETVIIGDAGTANSGAGGGNGGNSTFGAFITAGGGTGGPTTIQGSGGGIFLIGGNGGSATGGDINIPGQCGGITGSVATSLNVCKSGFGGNTPLGFGGREIGANAGGANGGLYGGGGSGAASSVSNGSGQAGGAGAAGIVVVYEYY